MPNIPTYPGVPIAPGVSPPNAGYPQYGVGGGTPGSAAGWNIVTANSDAEKMKYAQQGYLVWFSTMAAAQSYVAEESNPYTSGQPQGSLLGPLAEIGDFFHRLTEAQTWVRVGELGLGVIVIYAAFRGLTSGSSTIGSGARAKVTSPIKKVAKAGVTVAAPEARLAGRVAAKRVAPKTAARVAKHREAVAKYGQKKPYRPPEPKPPRVTYRHSTITHVRADTAAKPVARAKPAGGMTRAEIIKENRRIRASGVFGP